MTSSAQACSGTLILLDVDALAESADAKRGRALRRDKGHPQGAVVFAILANLFLHTLQSLGDAASSPRRSVRRYADDAVLSLQEADAIGIPA